MITINLLPAGFREELDYSKKNKQLLYYLYTLVALCLLLVASFILSDVFLKRSNSFFLNEIEASKRDISSYQSTLDDAKDLKARVNDLGKIKAGYMYWSKFDQVLLTLCPPGVYISSIETVSGNAKIVGYGKTKNDVALFQTLLAGYPGFSLVNLEGIKEVNDSENLDVKSQNFQITMKILGEALR